MSEEKKEVAVKSPDDTPQKEGLPDWDFGDPADDLGCGA